MLQKAGSSLWAQRNAPAAFSLQSKPPGRGQFSFDEMTRDQRKKTRARFNSSLMFALTAADRDLDVDFSRPVPCGNKSGRMQRIQFFRTFCRSKLLRKICGAEFIRGTARIAYRLMRHEQTAILTNSGASKGCQSSPAHCAKAKRAVEENPPNTRSD